MDGLPGLQRGIHTAGTDNVKPIKKLVGAVALAPGQVRSPGKAKAYGMEHLIIVALVSSLISVILVFLVLEQVGGGGVGLRGVGKESGLRWLKTAMGDGVGWEKVGRK
jgi:hypothetical protein